jgi:GDPmannose 4,6-dehydratase
LGDASKAREILGWKPTITFEDMIAEIVAADLEEAKKDNLCRTEGFQTYNHFDT